jgi:hypothetical protein
MSLDQHLRPIFANHFLPRVQDKSEGGTKQDEDHKPNIGSVVHSAVVVCAGVPVLAHWDGGSNDDSALENGPHDGHVRTLLVFRSKCSDGGSFCAPQYCCGETTPASEQRMN